MYPAWQIEMHINRELVEIFSRTAYSSLRPESGLRYDCLEAFHDDDLNYIQNSIRNNICDLIQEQEKLESQTL